MHEEIAGPSPMARLVKPSLNTNTIVTNAPLGRVDLQRPLAIEHTHQVALQSEDGWKLETGTIWVMSRKSSLTFHAGENGRTQYRAYCMLDCIGMEHLTKLLIQVA